MLTAHETASRVREGSVAARQAVDDCLTAIGQTDRHVRAWVELDSEGARRQAEALDSGDRSGLLAGVAVGIKDIVDVAGLPTRAGAPAFAHRLPAEDANVVRRLREAGAVILGKTHTTEFAYLDPAPTRNPWNLAHTPGGSSSGSGASVGARMLPMAIGSQTVGSVLRPAGYCGIIGFKPSFGRIGYSGTYALTPSYDHLGLLVTCVQDAALGLTAIAGFDPDDPNSLDLSPEDYTAALQPTRAPHLGLARSYYEAVVEPENSAHLDSVVMKLRGAGATVDEVTYPAAATEIADRAAPLMRYEAALAHAVMFESNRDDYRPNIRALVEAGYATPDDEYEQSKAFIAYLREAFAAILTDFDAVLIPTAPGTAPASLETTGPGIFCGPATFTGLPSISLPSGVAANGLPFSIQLMGPLLGEDRLLNVAAWVEGVLGFEATPKMAAST